MKKKITKQINNRKKQINETERGHGGPDGHRSRQEDSLCVVAKQCQGTQRCVPRSAAPTTRSPLIAAIITQLYTMKTNNKCSILLQ